MAKLTHLRRKLRISVGLASVSRLWKLTLPRTAYHSKICAKVIRISSILNTRKSSNNPRLADWLALEVRAFHIEFRVQYGRFFRVHCK